MPIFLASPRRQSVSHLWLLCTVTVSPNWAEEIYIPFVIIQNVFDLINLFRQVFDNRENQGDNPWT